MCTRNYSFNLVIISELHVKTPISNDTTYESFNGCLLKKYRNICNPAFAPSWLECNFVWNKVGSWG